jgi:hypothetical protein
MKNSLQALSIHPSWTSDHCDLLASKRFRVRVYGTVGVATGVYHGKGKYMGKVFDRRGRFTGTTFSR